jgi:hypothetical protein
MYDIENVLGPFDRIKMQTRTGLLGLTDSCTSNNVCGTLKMSAAGHIVYRAAFVGKDGIIEPTKNF